PLGEKRNHPGSKLRQGFWMVFRLGVNNWGILIHLVKKRVSIEIRFFKCCGFGSILSKNREILDTVKALNAGFYCLQPYIFS
ncbi:hypothetical protein, partial [Streptococcus pneumoniae]